MAAYIDFLADQYSSDKYTVRQIPITDLRKIMTSQYRHANKGGTLTRGALRLINVGKSSPELLLKLPVTVMSLLYGVNQATFFSFAASRFV